MGVITINKNIDKSKLSLNYLTYLMLHEFIHLIGFHIDNDDINFIGLITTKDNGYYLEYKKRYKDLFFHFLIYSMK